MLQSQLEYRISKIRSTNNSSMMSGRSNIQWYDIYTELHICNPNENYWYLACFSASLNLCGIMARNCWILSQILGSFSTLFVLSTLCTRAIIRATSGNTSGSLHDVVSRITPGTYSYANPLQNVAYRRGAQPALCSSCRHAHYKYITSKITFEEMLPFVSCMNMLMLACVCSYLLTLIPLMTHSMNIVFSTFNVIPTVRGRQLHVFLWYYLETKVVLTWFNNAISAIAFWLLVTFLASMHAFMYKV